MRALVLLCLIAGCAGSPKPLQKPGDPLRDVPGPALFKTGKALVERQDYVRAEQYLVAAITNGVSEKRVIPVLMRACIESSRMRAALGHAKPYLVRHPDDWRLRLLVASIHLSVGESSEATLELERVIQQDPNVAEAHYMLGVIDRDAVAIRQAKRHFREYLKLAPHGRYAAEAKETLSRARFRRARRRRR